MTPFTEHPMPRHDPKEYMERFGVSMEQARGMALQASSERLFRNDVYQVTLSAPHFMPPGLGGVTGLPGFRHLAIVRLDQQPIHSWADFQAIKNELIGPEYEAIEIYPAESRLVDMGHQYHSWVFVDPNFRLPIGWTERMVKGK